MQEQAATAHHSRPKISDAIKILEWTLEFNKHTHKTEELLCLVTRDTGVQGRNLAYTTNWDKDSGEQKKYGHCICEVVVHYSTKKPTE